MLEKGDHHTARQEGNYGASGRGGPFNVSEQKGKKGNHCTRYVSMRVMEWHP